MRLHRSLEISVYACVFVVMDSEVRRTGRLMDLVDEDWQTDRLPVEDITVPQMELPELEPDNGTNVNGNHETLREQEQKWTDLGLSASHDLTSSTATS